MSDFIVFDPNVANGAPFFKGTRISVAEVVEKLADGQTRDSLVQAYGGQIKAEAIAEALRLASRALAANASAFVSQAGASAAAGPGLIRGVSGELVLINPAKTHYGIGERVPFRQLIKNHTAQNVKYSFLGMLIVNLADGARRFHTSWSGDMTLPANGYGPQPDGWEDGITIDASGSYRITLDMCFASQDEGQKGVGWETLTAGTILTIGDAASVAVAPPAAPPQAYRSHGIVGNAFSVEKTVARVNEDVWFNFKVTNPTDQPVPYAILAARTESGQAAKSWSNEKLAPRQVLEWRDHINFAAPGVYRLYLGIGYGSFEDCFAMRAPWDRLSDSVTVTIS